MHTKNSDKIFGQTVRICRCQWHQSCFKTGGRRSGFENWGLQVLKVQQKKVHSTGFRVLFPEFFI